MTGTAVLILDHTSNFEKREKKRAPRIYNILLFIDFGVHAGFYIFTLVDVLIYIAVK
jgi:hypothetical protein